MKKEKMLAIATQSLGKRYKLRGGARYQTLGDSLTRFFRGSRLNRTTTFWALKDCTLQIPKGQTVGIVGNNGAGKTTLLKILGRVTRPTSGSAILNGRVGSLLEVGTGFHPELTGEENVYLGGAILGMSRETIKRQFDEVIHFAGVEDFIRSPLKHFSTGMQMRLAFSVAAHMDTDILLVDEVLAVGDISFQRKCLGKLEDASGEGRTVLFVSHQMNQIRRLCERVIWLDHGKVFMDGESAMVLAAYEQGAPVTSSRFSSNAPSVEFLDWHFGSSLVEEQILTETLEGVQFTVTARVHREIEMGQYAALLYDENGLLLWHGNWDRLGLAVGLYELAHKLPSLPLSSGTYRWKLGFHDGHKWSDPWIARRPLVVHSQHSPNTADEFVGVLNLPCLLDIHPVKDGATVEHPRLD